jgi:hypothetical protein
MQHDTMLAPITDTAKRVVELVKTDPRKASEIMATLSTEEQISLVTRQALRDPKAAQDLLFLLDDETSKNLVQGLADRTVFQIMKSQSSTHIGVLSIVRPDRVQAILDLDPELFSARGVTDPQAAYHWMVSFLEEDDETFDKLLKNLDIGMVASAFQDKILKPWTRPSDQPAEEVEVGFPADFLIKLDRGELKPDDLEVSDEETLDILTKIHLVDDDYFNELVSLMLRDEDLKARTAEEAFDRIHQQVGDMSAVTEEAEDMFVPLEE